MTIYTTFAFLLLGSSKLHRRPSRLAGLGQGQAEKIQLAAGCGAGVVCVGASRRCGSCAVAVTRAGRIEVRPEHPNSSSRGRKSRRGALTAHARATSWTAARATLRGMRWVSDREIRSLPGRHIPVIWPQPGTHRPDLGVVANGARIAVEVELTAKASRRLHAILAGYQQHLMASRLAGVLYVFEHPAVRNAIERTAGAVGMDRRQLELLPLDELETETRALAAAPATPQLSTATGTG